ncbi:MAG: DUF5320 domain-containing protein [Elusimicrobiales bacterium]
MLYGDGTGPMGIGRGRGLGRGPCGRGLRRGYAYGGMSGYGRGYRENYQFSKEDEINILKKQKEAIEQELNEVNKRIEEIEK